MMWLIGNTNTKRCHLPDCRAVPQIAPKHFVEGADFNDFPVICKFCYAGVGKEKAEYLNRKVRPDVSQTSLDSFRCKTLAGQTIKPVKKVMTKNQLKKELKRQRGLR
jgi:hypothetical protein